jgi:hypothetical protein
MVPRHDQGRQFATRGTASGCIGFGASRILQGDEVKQLEIVVDKKSHQTSVFVDI